MARGNEYIVAVLVILGICGVAIYRFILWVTRAPRTTDPWGKELAEALDRGEGVPLCHHCLAPQEHDGWFCPHCGATVGPYSNYLPFVYIFSQGEVLRAGVTERIRRSKLITLGFVLFSSSLSLLLAPVYWFFLFKHLRETQNGQPESPAVSPG